MSSDPFSQLEVLAGDDDLGGVLDVMWELQQDDAVLEALVERFALAESTLLRRSLAFILATALIPGRRGRLIRRSVRAYFSSSGGEGVADVDRTVTFNALTIGHRYALFLARRTDAAWLPEGLRPLIELAPVLGEPFIFQTEDVFWALSERGLLGEFFSPAERARFARSVSDPLVRAALVREV